MNTPTREELLKLAEQAGAFEGLADDDMIFAGGDDSLERFAALLQAQGEPVAWMREHGAEHGPTFTADPEAVATWAKVGQPLKPLYATPQSSDQVWNETLTKALQFYADGLKDDGSVAKVALWAVRTRSASGAGGELPPLPEPDTHCFDEDTKSDVWSHSADQMRDYARAAVELSRAKPAAQSAQVLEPQVTSDMMNQGADAMREGMAMLNSGRSYQAVCEKIFLVMSAAAPQPDQGGDK